MPRFGGHGAAAATSLSLTFETVLLFWIVRRRLGLHVLAFGKASKRLARFGTAGTIYFIRVTATELKTCWSASGAGLKRPRTNWLPSPIRSKVNCKAIMIATREELQVIDEAMASIDAGEFATDGEVAAAFAKFRSA